MPNLVRSFSNPGGSIQATGLDQLEEMRRGRQSGEALQREMLTASLAEAAAGRAHEMGLQGSFQDRTGVQDRMLQSQLAAQRENQQLANTGASDVARIGVSPQLGAQEESRRRFDIGREDTAAQRELDRAYAGAELGLVQGLAGSMKARPAAGVPGVFNDAVQGAGMGGGQAMDQDQAIAQLLRLKNPQAYFDSERRREDLAANRDTADTQTFATMAASTDPRVRALGIAGLQKTRAFGQLPAGTVQGLGKPLVGTGAEFVAKPEVQAEMQAIGQQLAAAGNDTNAEAMAAAVKPRIDRLVQLATEQGADPNQVLQDILGQLAQSAPSSSLYTNPLTTIGRAIPGLRDFVPEPSRDAARRVVGIQ
jgi:hypothetical protein